MHHVTWSINSICHFFGSRRFDTDDQSTNVFWLALPSLGEAWHHNHHAFPRSAFHGLRWYELDPSGWLILGARAGRTRVGRRAVTPEHPAREATGEPVSAQTEGATVLRERGAAAGCKPRLRGVLAPVGLRRLARLRRGLILAAPDGRARLAAAIYAVAISALLGHEHALPPRRPGARRRGAGCGGSTTR